MNNVITPSTSIGKIIIIINSLIDPTIPTNITISIQGCIESISTKTTNNVISTSPLTSNMQSSSLSSINPKSSSSQQPYPTSYIKTSLTISTSTFPIITTTAPSKNLFS